MRSVRRSRQAAGVDRPRLRLRSAWWARLEGREETSLVDVLEAALPTEDVARCRRLAAERVVAVAFYRGVEPPSAAVELLEELADVPDLGEGEASWLHGGPAVVPVPVLPAPEVVEIDAWRRNR